MRSDVGEAHQRLGAAREGREVDPIEDPGRAVAAANAPDGIDGGIVQGGVQIVEPLLVGAREIAVVAAGARGEHGFVTQRTAEGPRPG
jgi:hypothetical protein